MIRFLQKAGISILAGTITMCAHWKGEFKNITGRPCRESVVLLEERKHILEFHFFALDVLDHDRNFVKLRINRSSVFPRFSLLKSSFNPFPSFYSGSSIVRNFWQTFDRGIQSSPLAPIVRNLWPQRFHSVFESLSLKKISVVINSVEVQIRRHVRTRVVKGEALARSSLFLDDSSTAYTVEKAIKRMAKKERCIYFLQDQSVLNPRALVFNNCYGYGGILRE